jgi:hypothetical protein
LDPSQMVRTTLPAIPKQRDQAGPIPAFALRLLGWRADGTDQLSRSTLAGLRKTDGGVAGTRARGPGSFPTKLAERSCKSALHPTRREAMGGVGPSRRRRTTPFSRNMRWLQRRTPEGEGSGCKQDSRYQPQATVTGSR